MRKIFGRIKTLKKLIGIIKIKKRMPTLYDAYHESGHFLVSMLFYDELVINEITINTEKAQSVDKSYRGGFSFSWKTVPAQNDFNAGYKIALILLGGICSTTIFDKGIEFINQNIYKFPHGDESLSSNGGDYDYNFAKTLLNPISDFFQHNRISLQWNAFYFNFYYLIQEPVLNALHVLSNKLFEKEDKSLNCNELISILDEIGFIAFLNDNRDSIVINRIPLNRSKLLLKWPVTRFK